MAQSSSIEWTEMTWNPTTGCDKVSAGCKFCYAETMSRRLKAMGKEKYQNEFRLTLHPDALSAPYGWKKPRIVFVNSMSDLFHENVPTEFIQRVFQIMNETRHHTYQVLTKRADRLFKIHKQLNWSANIWMGVSVEDGRVVERIDYLRRTGAHIKFLSLEPLIGPLSNLNLENIHWAIVGGESGFSARPVNGEWITDIKKQCEATKVAFFFKQWGKPEFNVDPSDPTIDSKHPQHAKGGCQLGGIVYRAMPRAITVA
jgi:protein gp37